MKLKKAHPEIFNIFLQILDEGRITDGKGKFADFKNTIIILTSNLGSEYLLQNQQNKVFEILRKNLNLNF